MKVIKKLLLITLLYSSFIIAQKNSDLNLYGIVKSGILIYKGSYFYTGTGLVGLKNENLAFGVGIGFENYPNGSVIPLFGDFRVFLHNTRIKPFLFGEVGYSIAKIDNVEGWDKGGLMFKIGIGADFELSSGITLLGEVAYQHQKSKRQNSRTYYSTTKGFYSVISLEDQYYNLLGINIGIVIN